MNAPSFLGLARMLRALDPKLAELASDEEVAGLLPTALTCIRATLADRRRPRLPEPAQRPPIDDSVAWEGGGE